MSAGNRLSFSHSSKKCPVSHIRSARDTFHCMAIPDLCGLRNTVLCLVVMESGAQLCTWAWRRPLQSTWAGSVGVIPLKGSQRLVSGRWKVAVRVSAGTVVDLESQCKPLVVNEYSFQYIMLPLFCPWYAIKNRSFYINFLLNSFYVPMAIPSLPLSPACLSPPGSSRQASLSSAHLSREQAFLFQSSQYTPWYWVILDLPGTDYIVWEHK